jgi:hypothetical protein
VKARPTGPDGQSSAGGQSPFHVPPVLHVLGGLVHRYPRFWTWLGRVETGRLAGELRVRPVRQPIYVCGLARSGTTLLHEVVAAHPDVATHRAKDYPMVFTPYWWRRATAGRRPSPARERAHRDGVMMTLESPEALEEMIWMAFFPRAHDPALDNRLGTGDNHPAFEAFYDAHLRKLMLAEGVGRYVAKANYHLTRMPYLLRLYPDARFLVPVREPAAHVASLVRQQQWFSYGQQRHPRLLDYMRRAGHFEFGLDRRPMHLGDSARVESVRQAWRRGDEVRGVAQHWAMVYEFLADQLAADAALRRMVRVVRYEDVRESPRAELEAILDHCRLPEAAKLAAARATTLRDPTTNPTGLSVEERAVIREETAVTAARWGY